MKFDGIIFDLDGTLLNSLVGIADAMNLLLEQLGYPTHPLEPYRYFVGEGIRELVIRALPEPVRSASNIDQIDQWVARYREFYETTWPTKSDPYEGIPQLLDALTAQNIPMAILSNKSEDFTRRMTQTLLPKWPFKAVRGSRPGLPNKPDPQVALEIANQMDLEPGKTVFMGDTCIDMQTATRAQMIPVGVTWGFRPADELTTNGARHLLNHPKELMDILS